MRWRAPGASLMPSPTIATISPVSMTTSIPSRCNSAMAWWSLSLMASATLITATSALSTASSMAVLSSSSSLSGVTSAASEITTVRSFINRRFPSNTCLLSMRKRLRNRELRRNRGDRSSPIRPSRRGPLVAGGPPCCWFVRVLSAAAGICCWRRCWCDIKIGCSGPHANIVSRCRPTDIRVRR